jgi:hypothetical protein
MKPACLQTGPEDFIYTFEDEATVAEVRLIEDNSHGYITEFFIHTIDGLRIDRFTINLMASQTRQRQAGLLKGNLDWRVGFKDILEDMIAKTRAGEPTQDTAEGETPLSIHYLVGPTLKQDGLILFFGNYGEGKTMMAYTHAICVAYPELRALAPSPLTPHGFGPVMILDYEMGVETVKMTIRALLRGFGLAPIPGRILVKHIVPAFADAVRGFRTEVEVAQRKIKLVILDSQGPAMRNLHDGDPAVPVREITRALRSLGTTALMIAQVSKEEARRNGAREPYGSRAVSYDFDDTFEVRGKTNPTTQQLVTVLHHRKHRGPLNPAIAFSVDFPEPGVYRANGCPVPHEEPEEDEVLSKIDRLWLAIDPEGSTYEELAAKGFDRKQIPWMVRDLELAKRVKKDAGKGKVYRM